MKNSFEELKAFKSSYKLAMEIFVASKRFPKEELYSLTDQIRRSSRSVSTNIAEAYRKRQYRAHYLSKLSDSDAENSETIVWLNFAFDCGYINKEEKEYFINRAEETGKLIGFMMNNPDSFTGNSMVVKESSELYESPANCQLPTAN